MGDVVAVVLGAGFGTRLRPLTDHRPKALCPVANVPLVDHAIARASQVTDAIAVNVHSGQAQMEAHLAGRVHLSIEQPRPYGTAGALAALRDWIDGRDVLVLNADGWHPVPVTPLFAVARDEPRLLVVDDPARGDFEHWRYTGACLLPWSVVAGLPDEGGLNEVCFVPQRARGTLDLVPAEGPYFDCGTPSSYLAANLTASGGESVVGEGAVVDGELVRSVVWPGGRVAAGERLIESIRVGADLTVEARLEH